MTDGTADRICCTRYFWSDCVWPQFLTNCWVSIWSSVTESVPACYLQIDSLLHVSCGWYFLQPLHCYWSNRDSFACSDQVSHPISAHTHESFDWYWLKTLPHIHEYGLWSWIRFRSEYGLWNDDYPTVCPIKQ